MGFCMVIVWFTIAFSVCITSSTPNPSFNVANKVGFSSLPLHLIHQRDKIADANLQTSTKAKSENVNAAHRFIPRTKAGSFNISSLRGTLKYPGDIINHSTPLLFFSHNPASSFTEVLWRNDESIEDLILTSPSTTHYIFMTSSESASDVALWFQSRIKGVAQNLVAHKRISEPEAKSLINRTHYITEATPSLSSWIPDLLYDWRCSDHNCGIDQLKITDKSGGIYILPRLDARYDWLPAPGLSFGNKTLPAVIRKDPCEQMTGVTGTVVLTIQQSTNCSYAQMVRTAQAGGAVALVVMHSSTSFTQDMNCDGAECSWNLHIPATSVPLEESILQLKDNFSVTFCNEPSPNFFAAVDHHGNLAEAGWFLYPSMQFLAWQAQWFEYEANLELHLAKPALEVPVFRRTPMEGSKGATVNVTLPSYQEMISYGTMELDLSLSCEDTMDADCPHWDRTLHVKVCCDETSPLCGAELGRWISPFRRRIGRWLTDVTPLLPLFTSSQCTFTMTGALPGEIWVPSLTLRFTGTQGPGSLVPVSVALLYGGSFTFNKNYNTNFKPYHFTVPDQTAQVAIVSVITGHGSDENGCGEFCITSHHFTVNNMTYNRTFSNAGSPLGCANQVRQGVEPNEHGTWLYGRDGWCDGQEVNPWVITLGSEVRGQNILIYYGLFQGHDPDPKHNPGIMAFYSYLVHYKML